MKNMNVFIELLRCLNVKYTHGYAMDIYKGNPYHNSLYGLSMMLSHYTFIYIHCIPMGIFHI